MRALLIFGVLFGLATAEPPTSYGVSGGYDTKPNGPQYRPQIFRHVYVIAAPDEPVVPQSNVIRVPGGDKHVNVIFVKTPSSSSAQKTEVVLPEKDEQKNIVYILLKKGENNSNIKISRPPARSPTKPQVHFIQYKDRKNPGTGHPPATLPPSTPYGYY